MFKTETVTVDSDKKALLAFTPTEIIIDPEHPKFTQLVRQENVGRACISHEGKIYGISTMFERLDGTWKLQIHEVYIPGNGTVSMHLIQL